MLNFNPCWKKLPLWNDLSMFSAMKKYIDKKCCINIKLKGLNEVRLEANGCTPFMYL